MNEYSEMIEKALDEFLIKDNDVKGLVDSMEYSLMAGGKESVLSLSLNFVRLAEATQKMHLLLPVQ